MGEVMRFNMIPAGQPNPVKNGLYVRYDDYATLEAENAKLRAELERRAVDGWKLVPVEPTEEMRAAFNRVDAAIYRQPNRSLFKAKHACAAMLAAAPSAPKADEWVSVSERLPEPFTVVALLNIDRWMNTGSCDDFEANWTGAGWLNTSTRHAFWNAIGEPRGLTFDAVTHWMPLPVSPAIAAARKGEGE